MSTVGTDENDQPCYCVRNSSCILSSVFDEYDLTVEGVRSAGCFIIDMVLQSSLACWFNQLFFNETRSVLEFFEILLARNVTLLNPSLPSRFLPNTSIDLIVKELMIEQWISSSSFDQFYDKCRPICCSYTYQERIHLAYIITTILGLIGGLNVILRLICPLLGTIFLKCIKRINVNGLISISTNEQPITSKCPDCQ